MSDKYDHQDILNYVEEKINFHWNEHRRYTNISELIKSLNNRLKTVTKEFDFYLKHEKCAGVVPECRECNKVYYRGICNQCKERKFNEQA